MDKDIKALRWDSRDFKDEITQLMNQFQAETEFYRKQRKREIATAVKQINGLQQKVHYVISDASSRNQYALASSEILYTLLECTKINHMILSSDGLHNFKYRKQTLTKHEMIEVAEKLLQKVDQYLKSATNPGNVDFHSKTHSKANLSKGSDSTGSEAHLRSNYSFRETPTLDNEKIKKHFSFRQGPTLDHNTSYSSISPDLEVHSTVSIKVENRSRSHTTMEVRPALARKFV